MFFEIFTLVLVTLITAATFWISHCTTKTRNQRSDMIYKIDTDEDWARFDSVSFNQHFYALIRFQDPQNIIDT